MTEILDPEKYSIAELEHFKNIVKDEIDKKRAMEREKAKSAIDDFSSELGDLENNLDSQKSTF
jgi:hypothetical protein